MNTTRNQLRDKSNAVAQGNTELKTIIQRARELPPPGLDLPTDVKMPASLTFREASSRDVFQTIARFANIGLGFDTAFRDAPVTIDLRGASLDDALNAVADQTRTFFRVTAPRTVLVVPDTPAAVGASTEDDDRPRPFLRSNADLKEVDGPGCGRCSTPRRVSATTATNGLHDQWTRRSASRRRGRVISAAIDQGAAGSDHRSWSCPGGRPVADARVNSAWHSRAIGGLARGSDGSAGRALPDANQNLSTLQSLRNLSRNRTSCPAGVPYAALPPAQERHQYPHARESTVADERRHRRPGTVR